MPDQADILRHLVAGALRAPSHSAPPPLIAVAGAKGGVGTTTVAVNLAAAMAGSGQRVLVVDVNMSRPDVASLCQAHERYTTADVLAGRREIHEVLVSGPGGIQVAPGAWASSEAVECRPAAQRRLLDQLAGLGDHVEYVLLDVGCEAGEHTQVYWQTAGQVLLVTSPDSVAVMDAYAAIKVAGSASGPPIDLIINNLETGQLPAEIHHRIDLSCQRFLGFGVGLAGQIPFDEQAIAATRNRQLVCLSAPNSAAAQGIECIAGAIAGRSVLAGA